MEEYQFKMHYKAGVLNSNVDALRIKYKIKGTKEKKLRKFLKNFENKSNYK